MFRSLKRSLNCSIKLNTNKRFFGRIKIPEVYDPRDLDHEYWKDLEELRPYGEPAGLFDVSARGLRLVCLDRPKQLHALTLPMIRKLSPLLKSWNNADNVHCVIVRSTGAKAFCAGGDVVAIYKNGKSGGDTKSFFFEEYTLNHQIASLDVPYIAVINGVTMGGGVGLSVHGRYRIATENTLFAMPETAIGFFPDVGGSYFLPRLHGELGMFLALTGHRLKGADVYHAGVATHYLPFDKVPELTELLSNVRGSVETDNVINLMSHIEAVPEFSLEPHLNDIDECFSGNSVEDIVEALKAHGTEWSEKTLKTLNRMSPTALKVTYRQIREGASKSLEECFQMEYRISQRFMRDTNGDFFEGVRSLLVDGDKKFDWPIKELSNVSDDLVAEYFQPFDNPRDELLLGSLKKTKPKKDILSPDYDD